MFKSIAKRRGYKVTDSTKTQDIYDHVDLFIEKESLRISFDVKAMKKISRKDSSSQDELIYVEFKNVRGNPGWLYGKATCIAFETQDSFILVERKGLVKFCEENVDFKSFANRASDCLYKLYRREGRKDLISMVELNKIPKEIKYIWKK